MKSLIFRFDGIERCNQHTANRTAVTMYGAILLLWNISSVKKQFQPILRFVTFLLGNFQLGDKVLRALGILRFVKICTDGGSAAQKLIGQNGFFMGRFNFSTEKDDLLCKFLGLVTQWTVGHGDHLGTTISA